MPLTAECAGTVKYGDPGGCTNIINLLLEDKVVLQEYVAVSARSVYKFEGLSYTEATLAEPLTVALEMLVTARVGLGQDVVRWGLVPSASWLPGLVTWEPVQFTS